MEGTFLERCSAYGQTPCKKDQYGNFNLHTCTRWLVLRYTEIDCLHMIMNFSLIIIPQSSALHGLILKMNKSHKCAITNVTASKYKWNSRSSQYWILLTWCKVQPQPKTSTKANIIFWKSIYMSLLVFGWHLDGKIS